MKSRSRSGNVGRTRKAFKFRRSDRPARCSLDSEGEGIFGVDLAAKDQAGVTVGDADCFAQITLAKADFLQHDLEGVEFSHTPKLTTPMTVVNAVAKSNIDPSPYNARMSAQWKFRDAFVRLMDEYRKKTGASVEEIADAIGKSTGTVRAYGRKTGAPTPPKETIYKIATLFGVSPFEMMDDDRQILAIDGMSELPALTRHQFGRMIQAVQDDSLTQEDIDILFEDFIRDARRMADRNRRGMK